jgi:hypothetical protein
MLAELAKNDIVRAMLGNKDYFQDQEEYWLKIFLRKRGMTSSGTISFDEFEDSPKILLPGKQLIAGIGQHFGSPVYGYPQIISQAGVTLLANKTGSGMNTTYTCNTMPLPCAPVPLGLYEEGLKFNLIHKAIESLEDPDYIWAWMNHVLKGTPEPKRPAKVVATQHPVQMPSFGQPAQQQQPQASQPLTQQPAPNTLAVQQPAFQPTFQQPQAAQPQPQASPVFQPQATSQPQPQAQPVFQPQAQEQPNPAFQPQATQPQAQVATDPLTGQPKVDAQPAAFMPPNTAPANDNLAAQLFPQT